MNEDKAFIGTEKQKQLRSRNPGRENQGGSDEKYRCLTCKLCLKNGHKREDCFKDQKNKEKKAAWFKEQKNRGREMRDFNENYSNTIRCYLCGKNHELVDCDKKKLFEPKTKMTRPSAVLYIS